MSGRKKSGTTVMLDDDAIRAAKQIASWVKLPLADAVHLALLIAHTQVVALKLEEITSTLKPKKANQGQRSRVAREG